MISFVTLFVLGYFNSRPHGGRLLSVFSLPGQEFHFNSRPHGGRPASSSTVSAVSEFQLTPSRRATLCCHPRRFSHVYFNSRPHGGRQQPSMVSLLLFHFNSRPHGGRRSALVSFFAVRLFQLTPSRRATLPGDALYLMALISTHALTEGDADIETSYVWSLTFQLTPSRRATANLDKFFF